MATKRIADCTPEEAQERRRKQNEYRRAHRKTEAGKKAKAEESKRYREAGGEALRKRHAERSRKYRAESPEKKQANNARYRHKHYDIVQAVERRRQVRNSTPRRARDLLSDIRRRAPNIACRDDIVSVTALLVCEGVRLGDAVRRATKMVLKDESFTQYSSVPIEECFWL